MKRVRVYQQILSEDNLRLAIREVNRGHQRNGDHSLNKKVLEIEANMDEYVAELRRFIEDLVSGDAHMHPPLKRRRWDRNADSGKGKWRDINEPLLWPDQYVHHAVLQPMIPHIMRSMDKYCIASVPGTVTPSSESTTCFGSSKHCIYITTEGIETGSSRLSGPPA